MQGAKRPISENNIFYSNLKFRLNYIRFKVYRKANVSALNCVT